MNQPETQTFVIIITAIGTFIATIFGRDGWQYMAKRKEIDSGLSCKEKIRELEEIIAEQKLQTQQIVTGVDMMLTMLEDEFGSEVKYQNVIKKVREYINNEIASNVQR